MWWVWRLLHLYHSVFRQKTLFKKSLRQTIFFFQIGPCTTISWFYYINYSSLLKCELLETERPVFVPLPRNTHRQSAWIWVRVYSFQHHYRLATLQPIRLLNSKIQYSTLYFTRVKVHKRTPFMSSSSFFKQWPAYLVHLTWMVCEIGGKWLYSSYFVRCCFQDLFKRARSIIEKFPSSSLSIVIDEDHLINLMIKEGIRVCTDS